jgi:ribosomal protein L37AE/L43A
MDAVALLREARACGLTVTADGDQLVVTGPKSAADVVRKLADNKPAVLAELRSSTDVSALSAVGRFPENPGKEAKPADADKQNEPPHACQTCGSALGWRTEDGRVACAACEQKPPTADMLVLVDTDAGPIWRRHDDERPVDVQRIDGPDPWDEAIPWEESTPSCPTCKSAEGWVDARDQWHCWKCCPPFRTEKLLNDRERLLRAAWRRTTRRQGGQER